jgi:ferric-dicitrate binding protein FerR (iron transport regulator)
VRLNGVSLEEALKAIATAGDVTIAFSADVVPVAQRVSVRATNEPLAQVMRTVLSGRDLELLVSPSGQLVVAAGAAPAQPTSVASAPSQAVGTVSGVVTGGTGAPLAGASVAVAGTSRGDQTDAQGRYTITGVPAGSRTVRATFAGYAESSRAVDLVGEAYFDVAPDADHPFVIVAGTTVTRVLGTEFGVRAYPGDSAVQVAVADGRVAFRASATSEGEAVVLRPGELGRIEAGSAQVSRQAVNLDAYLGWQEGRLAFEDAPLSQVAAQLERWYGIPVRIGDASLRSRRLTASFRDQPVDEVIAVVAATLGLEYARVGQVYTFFPKDRVGTLASL